MTLKELEDMKTELKRIKPVYLAAMRLYRFNKSGGVGFAKAMRLSDSFDSACARAEKRNK